ADWLMLGIGAGAGVVVPAPGMLVARLGSLTLVSKCWNMQFRARHYATGEPVEIRYADGRITSVAAVPDASGWVAPALFDLQINGCEGHSFTSGQLTVDKVRHVVGT